MQSSQVKFGDPFEYKLCKTKQQNKQFGKEEITIFKTHERTD